jgi:3-methylfumaryl-CoA hydratase
MADKLDLDHLRQWIGRSEERTDIVTAHLVAGLRSALFLDIGAPRESDAAPLTTHWCLTLPVVPLSEIGPDGHPKRGGFLPPVPLPRRMGAGGEINFIEPLRVGDAVTRISTIKDVTVKTGSTGTLCFVSVDHAFATKRGPTVRERHDIVYREAPRPGAPAAPAQAAPTDEAFSREIVPDPVLLFRYSALTFNGHRIHYDRSYVTEVEGYPGLVVHGPLIATLLLDLLRRERPEARVRRFEFRALRPVFDIHRFTVCGRPDGAGRFRLWARDHEGAIAMQADAQTL